MATSYSDGCEYHIRVSAGQVGNYAILPGNPGRCKAIALEELIHCGVMNREVT